MHIYHRDNSKKFMRAAEKEYHNEMIKENQNNLKELWDLIRLAIGSVKLQVLMKQAFHREDQANFIGRNLLWSFNVVTS